MLDTDSGDRHHQGRISQEGALMSEDSRSSGSGMDQTHTIEVKATLEGRASIIVARWEDHLHDIKLRSLEALDISPTTEGEYRLLFDGREVTDESQPLTQLVKNPELRHVHFHLKHVLTYYVNGEAETTTKRELTVGAILESAEFTPITSYKLKSVDPPHDYGTNYTEEVKVHQGQHFQALFIGPTPTS
jgi:hypothetical protein